MCGIAGGIGRGISSSEAALVRQALKHRGPDDSGIFEEDGIWLLNTRLAIQDLSAAGHQPMTSADENLVMVYNGEIYNHHELRKTLAANGSRFRGESDTETLLHCWLSKGEACLPELEGDFAFAVFDKRQRRLTLVRDRMGVKPLYWYSDGRQVLFASELKALLKLPELDLSLDTSVFGNYLLYQYNPDERTPFARIRKLPPSHILTINLTALQPDVRRYYSIPFGGKPAAAIARNWQQETAATLEKAISGQMLSDAPLGLTLSGGLDSALVAAFARKARPHQKLDAYCIDTKGGMSAEGFAEDAGYARLVADKLGLHLKLVSGDYDLGAEIDAMVNALDEPQADPAAINIRLIAQAARADGNRVLLSGTGADDLFSGYRRHQLLRFHWLLQYAPSLLRRAAPALGGHSAARPAIRRIEKVLATSGRSALDAAIHSFFWTEPTLVTTLLNAPVASLREPYALFKNLLQEIPREHRLLNQVLFLEQRSFLPHHNLAYMDKLSMAEGVEMRVPYADRDLVSLAAALPVSFKMRGGETKAVLRAIGRELLPKEIIDRPKTGFAFPLRSWVRGAGQPMIRERLFESAFLDSGIFNRNAVIRFTEETIAGRRDGAYTLFSLLCIESWLRQFSARK
jgi:asparagine synthase (glutamine-hydrolysing)